MGVMGLGMMATGSESIRNAFWNEMSARLLEDLVPHLRLIVFGAEAEAQLPPPAYGGGAEAWRPNRGNNYPKLAQLVQAVESSAALSGFEAPVVLSAIEFFSLASRAQWLKVAAGSKASMINDAVTSPSAYGGINLELGSFVGYTAIRLAMGAEAMSNRRGLQNRDPIVTSFEVDPIHVCVARHFVRIACIKSAAEVWMGQVKDVAFRLLDLGGCCVTSSFMDHCGTSFHDDLARLTRAGFTAPGIRFIADNVLEPGAPVFAWMVRMSESPPALIWALHEFGSMITEDWMVVSCPATL